MPSNSNQPYSAKAPRSLPTFTTGMDAEQVFAMWQNQLAPGIQNASPQVTPSNFSVTNSRGGLSLSWSPVQNTSRADGYEILKSASGSFTDDLQVIPVKNVNQSGFFDATGGTANAASYRIRTTSGTPQNPQSQRGPESGPVRHTSIDAADTKTSPTTKFDNSTTDATRSLARQGNYGAFKQSPLGKVGGSSAGTGAGSGAGSSTGSGTVSPTPTPGTGLSFSMISGGENITASMVVGGTAQIIPDTSNPGTIDATQLQGVAVSASSTPSSTNSLQYNSANNDLEYAATPQTITSSTSNWLTSYSASTGSFTKSQPAASDLSNGTTGTGTVVLAASPALSGTPTAPTASAGTSTTQIATTAFVETAVGSYLPLAGGIITGNLTLDAELIDGTGAHGTSGQVLSSTGTATKWVAASSGSSSFNMVSKTGAYGASANDYVQCNTSSAGFTVTLPASSGCSGEPVIVKKTSSDTNIVTVACSGSDTIDGSATITFSIQNTALEFVSNGSNGWEIS